MSSPSSTSPLPERIGPYRIVKKLGQGGMGAVYLAEDTRLGRKVALKVPQFRPEDGRAVCDRFLREAKLAAQLNHPNICPLHDVGEADGRPYLTMAFIEGRPLSDFVRPGKPLPPRTAAALVAKLALALAEAHAAGIVHRDLKPANVTIDRRKEPIVMDFGLARNLDPRASRHTQEGALLGTPAFMSPEQAEGRADVGPASDLYSLGVILYELLTGRVPFEGPPLSVLARLLRDAAPPPLREHRADLDPALEAICLKAMARDPANRHANMTEFARALQGWMRGEAVSATAPPSVTLQPAAPPAETLTATASLPAPAGASPFADLAPTEPAPARPRPARRGKKPLPPWAFVAGGAGVVLLVALALLLLGGRGDQEQTAQNSPGGERPPPPPPPAPAGVDTKPPPPPGPVFAAAPAPWQALFNGKDLTGWVPMLTTDGKQANQHQPGGEECWRVADNEIVCAGGKAGWLRSEREYRDFVLTLEFQLPAPKGNSGLYVRSPEQGHLSRAGMEIQLLAHDDVANKPENRSGSIWGVVPATWFALKPAGEWNHLQVRCEGEAVEVVLNGVPVVDTRMDAHPPLNGRPRKGYVGLANWNDEAKGARFRHIFLCDLTDTTPTPPLTAAVTEGDPGVIATWFEPGGPRAISPAFSPDGRKALVSSTDGTLGLWDVTTGHPIRVFADLGQPVTTVAFAPEGGRALSIAGKGNPTLWDLRRLKKVRDFDGPGGPFRAVAFTPDGRHALVGGEGNPNLVYWDTATDKAMTWAGHATSVIALSFSADGQRAISGDARGGVIVWDAAGAKVLEFPRLPGAVTSVRLSRDGTTAYTGGYQAGPPIKPGSVTVWSLRGGQPREVRKLPGTWIEASADGTRVMSNGEGNAPHSPTMMIDFKQGKWGQNFYPCESPRYDCTVRAMSPDGRLALIAGRDGRLLLWRLPRP